MHRDPKDSIRINEAMILSLPPSHIKAAEEQKAKQDLYQLIHEKVEHIVENKKLTRGELVDRITDMVVKHLDYYKGKHSVLEDD